MAAAAVGILLFPFANCGGAAPGERPNIVYLLADDLGWGDLGLHGGSIPTPSIDHLARQGIEFTNFMGWCVCSPTRAMLLTGRHPFRVGTGPGVGGELPLEETTIAQAFKANGYRTGIFGKWHNGEDPDTPEYRKAFEEAWKAIPNKKLTGGFGVNAHGFDEAWVYYGGGADYFSRRTVQGRGPVSWWHNREYRPQDAGYTDDLITQNALAFIRENKSRPFFCYVPFHIVHAPLQAKDSDLEGVDAKVTDKTKRTYAAMVQAMDRNIGTLLAELDKLGLRDNTIVVFNSDNGATRDGSNLPLRGGKHSLYEGGVRLPTVIHWTKGGLAGGGKWDGLCGALDMFPTLTAMAGCPLPETRPLDGKNIWPALKARGASPVESYYWVWRNEDALRTAQWKLHRFFDHDELYDISQDPAEAANVADAHPEVVGNLKVAMDAWAKSLNAALSHRPMLSEIGARPAPEGDVLEVTVTVTGKSKPKDRLVVPFATSEGSVLPTDRVEYDIRFAPDSMQGNCFYSPATRKDGQNFQSHFEHGIGFDQFGREQATGPAAQGGAGVWERRVIGMCSFAPNGLGQNALVFMGGKPGTYKVWLDNLRLRHSGGEVTPIWTQRKDTRFRPIADSEAFKNVKVHAISLSESSQ